jgi:hypothetical protein
MNFEIAFLAHHPAIDGHAFSYIGVHSTFGYCLAVVHLLVARFTKADFLIARGLQVVPLLRTLKLEFHCAIFDGHASHDHHP